MLIVSTDCSGRRSRASSEIPPDAGPFYMIDLDYYDASAVHLDVPALLASS